MDKQNLKNLTEELLEILEIKLGCIQLGVILAKIDRIPPEKMPLIENLIKKYSSTC